MYFQRTLMAVPWLLLEHIASLQNLLLVIHLRRLLGLWIALALSNH